MNPARALGRLSRGLRVVRSLGLLQAVLWCCVLASGTLLSPHSAGADAPALDVAQLSGGVSLTAHLTAFEDVEGRVTLDGLLSKQLDSKVKTSFQGYPSYGFSDSTVWLRFEAVNPDTHPHPFLVELAYPLLEHVELYIVHGDGRRERRATGDMLPFSQRDLPLPDFVFRLTLAPGTHAAYYLRLQTKGVLKAPLSAWEPTAFLLHRESANLGLWMYYGALAVLALYNLCVFVMLRQAEYLAYMLLALPLAAVSSTFNGQTAQYLLPNHPELANRALPTCIGLVLAAVGQYAHLVLREVPGCEAHARHLKRWVLPASLLAVYASVSDPGMSLRVALAALVIGISDGVIQLVTILRRKSALIRLYNLSWLALLVAVPVQLLRYVNVLPPSFLTDWALQIGFAVHGVMSSLALASRVNIMRDQLAHNVTDLEGALKRAEEANDKARRATAAKDEFMATMSHELRTPLNAIINVPPGLLDDFVAETVARCATCGAAFLLEDGEGIDAQTVCQDCGGEGTLVARGETRYRGSPERTMRHLRRIERSGRHLLQMVNGVLDFSKIEAGHLALQPISTDLGALLREVLEDVGDLAAKKQLRLTFEAAETPLPTVVDPTRVRQIVLNLLSNAVKFTEDGRAIEVRWEALPEADVVEVRDHGIGIDPADHERVFQRFEQVHKGDTRKYGGTGLGLPISRSLARLHGGDLTLRSARGAGSTFTLTLPRRVLGEASASESADD